MKNYFILYLLCFGIHINAQNDSIVKPKSKFWDKVNFGGGLGLGFGNGSTNISFSPLAVYNFTPKIAAGLGLNYSYIKQRDFFQSSIYGGSIVGFYNPIQEVQISMELEQLRVNSKILSNQTLNSSSNFWNTALFMGAGYNTGGLVIGIRYNVLYKQDNNVYSQAWLPFVRIIF